ncbi:hypothetical protein N7481_001332 [Penicillium waksmanii]|uniref:uncharacterized protein n=1 Tax=Penicillium waksmanii TaxID=69791 RepID=UPI0025489DCE|nr:uncharacterized protein N7481_010275 [Penicillium waksmanii]XP_057128383.1 uncharacterized protein N7481_001332 [Penicillium waksmanii]KAJ5976568.1 hypothetical protein N7481_010275 [Penicillium waksmanii]KAJ6000923.1 hypothetical protein N7481_001332 [Penicillium waksmanii]
MSRLGSADQDTRNIDIAQVSLTLQDRLGLAKLKYQHGQLHGPNFNPLLESDNPSDSSLDFSRSRCETPFTSPYHRAAIYSKALPRPARNKHAVTFNYQVMQPMLFASRKRLRSDAGAELPAKSPRFSWKSSYQLPESSPSVNRHLTARQNHVPSMSEASVPEISSPVYHGSSDEENEPDLPLYKFRNMSFVVDSFSPRIPPPKHARLSCNNRMSQHEDGADLRYLAKSPSARVAADSSQQALLPSTPPSKHVALPSLTPNLGTPDQQFNFADFVNVTPSPVQPVWVDRTPRYPGRTPPSTKDARKRLNSDELVPDNTLSPEVCQYNDPVLQLGGQL